MNLKPTRQQPESPYPDRGASAQIYCNDRFIELETLGPLVSLAPDHTVTHVEIWSLSHVGASVDVRDVPRLLELDG